jgi:hypothetical protein
MADGIVEYILRLDDRTKAGTASATAGSRKLEAQTEATTRAVDDLGDETAQTGRQLTTMGRQSQTAGQGVGRFGGVLGGLKTRLAGVSASSVALGAALGAGALLGTVTAVAGAFQRMGQEIADARNDITDASTRSGIATETLEGLRLAAEGSGLSFSALTSGLDQFGARLSQAAEGTGRTAEAFAALGVEVVDAQGNLRDGDAVLRETLASLNAMEPTAERSALAVEALGRTGGKLLQALSGTELEAFVALTREFGVGVGPKAAESAGKWQRATAELDTVMAGLKAKLFDAVGGADALFEVTELLIYGFEFAAGAIDGFADGMASAVDRILAPFNSLVAALDQLFTALQQIGNGDFSGGLFSMQNALEELTQAATETPAAIASALTAGVVEASFTAGVEGARRADVEGGESVSRLRQLRADILSGAEQEDQKKKQPKKTPSEDDSAAGEAYAEAAARVFASGFQEDRARLSDVLAEGAANLAEQQAKTAAMAAETRAGRLEAAQTAIGVTGQALSGDLGGALSSAGGAAGLAGLGVAGAAVSGLQFIGEQGAQGISDTLDGLKAALLGALEALPELIGDVLPRFAVALVADLIPALIRAAPQIFYSLVVELPKAIGQAIVDALSFDTDKLTKRVERSEFLQNVVAVGSFLNPFATEAEKEARRAELTDRGDQSEVLGQRSRSASRTATDGQMGTARESDRLAMMSTRPRMTRATVKSNPFDDLARQYDVQFGEYGRARSTTIRPAAT